MWNIMRKYQLITAVIIVCLSALAFDTQCGPLRNTDDDTRVDNRLSSEPLQSSSMPQYLDAFHSINAYLLTNKKHIKRKTKSFATQHLSSHLSRQINPAMYNGLSHHIFVKTETDVEKLIVQFPLTSHVIHSQKINASELLEYVTEYASITLNDELRAIGLVNEITAYQIFNEVHDNTELVFEFDLTQLGLVQKRKIVSLLFHHLQALTQFEESASLKDSSLIFEQVFSVESMRLWHFSNDQLIKKGLRVNNINFAIKPFNKFDIKQFKEQYPRSIKQLFMSGSLGDLIYSAPGLNAWLAHSPTDVEHERLPTLLARSTQYKHNKLNFVMLNLLSEALKNEALLMKNETEINDNWQVSPSVEHPFALEFVLGTNLIEHFLTLRQFTLNKDKLNAAKNSYRNKLKLAPSRELFEQAQEALSKATISTVNRWQPSDLLATLETVHLEQFSSFYQQFFNVQSVDVLLTHEDWLAKLPPIISRLEQSVSLAQPSGHITHYNRYYTPAVGTLLNKRIEVEGDKNYLLDVYVSPVRSKRHLLITQIITEVLKVILASEAPWLDVSFQHINNFPAITFQVDTGLDDMKQVKEAINKLVLEIKPRFKKYSLEHFNQLLSNKSDHYSRELNKNKKVRLGKTTIARYHIEQKIRPSDIIRAYEQIFLEHEVENILIQLNGRQNNADFFVALPGENVR